MVDNENFYSEAEEDIEGNVGANVVDGLFAIARAINFLGRQIIRATHGDMSSDILIDPSCSIVEVLNKTADAIANFSANYRYEDD